MEFARSTGDVVILPQTTDDKNGEEFTLLGELSGRRLGEGCHLWNRSISPKPIVEFFDVHGGCYCLDFMQSEVVNVIRSHRSEKSLSMGRLHIETTLLTPDGNLECKSSEFLDWFEQLRKWVRKSYPYTHDGARLSVDPTNYLRMELN